MHSEASQETQTHQKATSTYRHFGHDGPSDQACSAKLHDNKVHIDGRVQAPQAAHYS